MKDSSEHSTARFLSFAEIVQDRDHVVKVSEDGLLYAVDLVMVMTGKNRDMAGNVLRRLPEDLFQSSKFIERRPVNGGYPTKLISFHDAIDLVMVLPGKKAKKVKTQFADVIRRYMAGDQTLISEIRYNATSTSPVAQLARESINSPNEHETNARIKRKLEESDALIGNENVTLAKQMVFVEKAFEYQRTALDLIENQHIMEQNERTMTDLIKKKNDLLEEIKELDELEKELDLEIQTIEPEYKGIKPQLADKIKTIRILSGLRIESDHVE